MAKRRAIYKYMSEKDLRSNRVKSTVEGVNGAPGEIGGGCPLLKGHQKMGMLVVSSRLHSIQCEAHRWGESSLGVVVSGVSCC